MKPIGPMIHIRQLFRLAFGSEGAFVRETHIIAPSASPQETVDWLEWRGYRVAVVQPVKVPTESFPTLGGGPIETAWEVIGRSGVLFGRKNQPMILAQVGDVLVWDGYRVTIQED